MSDLPDLDNNGRAVMCRGQVGATSPGKIRLVFCVGAFMFAIGALACCVMFSRNITMALTVSASAAVFTWLCGEMLARRPDPHYRLAKTGTIARATITNKAQHTKNQPVPGGSMEHVEMSTAYFITFQFLPRGTTHPVTTTTDATKQEYDSVERDDEVEIFYDQRKPSNAVMAICSRYLPMDYQQIDKKELE